MITHGGKIIKQPDYQFLSIHPQAIEWQKPGQYQPLPLGVEYTETGSYKALSACKVNINGFTYQGKMVSGRCNIAIAGQEKSYPDYVALIAKQ